LRVGNTPRRRRYHAVTAEWDGQTTGASQFRRVTIMSDVSTWPRMAALSLLLAGCRQGAPAGSAATEHAAAFAGAAEACATDSLRPVAAAPAAGLWVSERSTPTARVAAMVGPASVADRARITRRVETLELRDGADTIRLATDTASVTLVLLPRPGGGARHPAAGAAPAEHTEPAAVYAITPLVLLASYEPCDASAGEPRIRYLRRDERGGVATDLMLRRESAETAGALR